MIYKLFISCFFALLMLFLLNKNTTTQDKNAKQKTNFTFKTPHFYDDTNPKLSFLKKLHISFTQKLDTNKTEKAEINYESLKASLNLNQSSEDLQNRLFAFDENNQSLWQNHFSTMQWELWRDNSSKNSFLYNLSSNVYYLLRFDSNKFFLSDELSISLQRKGGDFFLSKNTPKAYKHFKIQSFSQNNGIFIFKLSPEHFIIAQLLDSYTTKWWELDFENENFQKLQNLSSSFFSNDIMSFKIYLSDESCKNCEDFKQEYNFKELENLILQKKIIIH